MEREELVKALRRHYDLPEYMLDSDVLSSCGGLPGVYWIKTCAWSKRNWKKVGYATAIIATAAIWLLIAHLALEELAR